MDKWTPAAQRLARMEEDRSILDEIAKQVPQLQIERRIQLSEKQSAGNFEVPDAPVGVPDTFDEHVKLILDKLKSTPDGDGSLLDHSTSTIIRRSRSWQPQRRP